MTAYETIRYVRSGHIGNLTLARPHKHNAQHPLMWEELADLGAALLPDQTLRCLVVAGEGPSPLRHPRRRGRPRRRDTYT